MDDWAAEIDVVATFDGRDAEVGLVRGLGLSVLMELAEDAVIGDRGEVSLEVEFLEYPVAEFFGPEGDCGAGGDVGVALVRGSEPGFGLAGDGQERVVWAWLQLVCL